MSDNLTQAYVDKLTELAGKDYVASAASATQNYTQFLKDFKDYMSSGMTTTYPEYGLANFTLDRVYSSRGLTAANLSFVSYTKAEFDALDLTAKQALATAYTNQATDIGKVEAYLKIIKTV